MVGRPALHPWAVGMLMFVVTVCLTPIGGLDQVFLQAFGTGILFWTIVATSVSLLSLALHGRLMKAYPDPHGSVGLRLLAYLRGVVYLVGGGLMLDGWLTLLSWTTLPATPRMVLIVVIVIVVFYAVRLGLEATARIVGLIGFLVLPVLAFILLALIPMAHWNRLLPELLGPMVVTPVWSALLFAPRGYIMVPIFGRYVVDQKYTTAAYLGVIAGGVVISLGMTLPGLVFGWPTATLLPYPFFQVTGTVTSVFLPFQRIQFLLFIMWQMIIFGIATTYAIATLESFHIKTHPLSPIWAAAGVALFFGLEAVPMPPRDQTVVVFVLWSIAGAVAFWVWPGCLLLTRRWFG